jgi:hypothetical protein
MIYLDHNATTPVLPEVFEAMRPYFCEEWGNPSSAYKFGSKLKGAIETARARVAELIGAQPREIIFTSCATESNNAAIHAALKPNPGKRHMVSSAVDHSSVLNYCMALEKDGCRVTYLPVDRDGLLKLADLENVATDETAVVSLMWADNETGMVFPVKEIAEFCCSRVVLNHPLPWYRDQTENTKSISYRQPLLVGRKLVACLRTMLERSGLVSILAWGKAALTVAANWPVMSFSLIPIPPRRMTIFADLLSNGATPCHDSVRNCQYLLVELCRSSFDTFP